MEEIISLIFFALAACCNAVMDTIQFHWYKFRWRDKVNEDYWNPKISWRNKYIDGNPKKGFKFKFPFGGLSNFLDAWHLFKMSSIILIVLSIVYFPFSFKICFYKSYFWNELTWVVIYGITWIVPFNIFFNKILVDKEK